MVRTRFLPPVSERWARRSPGKIGAPEVTTLVTVLDVLVAFVIVAALIGGDAYLNHAAHLAPPPGDHTPGT